MRAGLLGLVRHGLAGQRVEVAEGSEGAVGVDGQDGHRARTVVGEDEEALVASTARLTPFLPLVGCLLATARRPLAASTRYAVASPPSPCAEYSMCFWRSKVRNEGFTSGSICRCAQFPVAASI